MPKPFDPEFEELEYCELVHKCRSEKCGDDIYLLPGWDKTLSLVRGNFGERLESYTKPYFKNHTTYFCENLPLFEHEHKIDPITEELVKEINRLSGDKKVNLLGTSYGGIIAQRMASNHPDKVNKIALLFSFQKIAHDDNIGLSPKDVEAISGWMMSDRVIQFFKDIFLLYDGVSRPDPSDDALGRPKDIVTLFGIDEVEKNKNITADTFILNCHEDRLFGEIPNIEGAIVKINSPCAHHKMEVRDLTAIAKFLGEDPSI